MDALAAAEAALNIGDLVQARARFAAIRDGAVSVHDLPRVQLFNARLTAAEGFPQLVLMRLPMLSADARINAEAGALRAEALQAIGDTVGAVNAWVERTQWLTGDDLHRDNQARLWQGLQQAPLSSADVARASAMGSVVEGWVALGLLARQPDPARQAAWPQRYAGHPGLSRFQLLGGAIPFGEGSPHDFGFSRPSTQPIPFGRWAVLLPLSGPLAATAESIRDGWLTAYLAAGAQMPVDFLDTGGTEEGALRAYRQALSNGARLIIGPLRKEEVAALTRESQLPVPVIALNQLDPQAGAPVINLFQFALAPEDEARAVADHAVSQGYRQAVTLLPEGEWGARVEAAFRERLVTLGGDVVGSARYAPRTDDYSTQIKSLMRIGDSEGRYRQLSGILGTRPVFEPRRRPDVDFIFFAGRPTEGRQIWSQFRFHRAQDLPAYATSMIYDDQARPGADLVGSRFCDMNWMIDPTAQAELRASSARLPGRDRQPRLFAMGLDAFALASQVARGLSGNEAALLGATGELRFGRDGVIERRLDCARFTAGGIAPLPRVASTPVPSQDSW